MRSRFGALTARACLRVQEVPLPTRADPSVDPRTVVTCPHGTECPGCPLLALSYGEQLAVKHARVVEAFAGFAELCRAPISAVVPADPIVGYRSRAKLVASGPLLGLYAKGTHRVVDIPHCRVEDGEVARVAEALRRRAPEDVALRAVDLQRAGDRVFLTLVVPDHTDEARANAEARRALDAIPELAGIAVSYRDERSHQVLGRPPVIVAGKERAPVRVLGESGPFHFVAPGGFAQAHRGQQRRLLEAVLAAVAARFPSLAEVRVLDLFSGAGALALALAARGARVVAVESYAPAAALARDAAAEQRLEVQVEAADAEDIVRELVTSGERPDVVIVNPPRRGISPATRAAIARLAPSLVLYVSCEPWTLARDLSDLGRHGLAVRAVAPFDMMPLTEEVEALATLGPGEPPLPEVLYEDEALIAVVKAPHEPTIPQGEHAGSLLGRVRRKPGAEEAVPVHRLDIGTSGVCLFARRPEHASELSQALALGQKEYLALCKGVVRDKGSVRRPLPERGRPQEARTRYSRRDVVGGHSLVVARPDEGRKHQIRRHLASIAHPIVGDDRYGDPRTNAHFRMRHFLDRPFLHCARIVLELGGHPLELESPLAPDLVAVLNALTTPPAVE
jgi:23S rRNA (uracil1939-C5)-methyltransferase